MSQYSKIWEALKLTNKLPDTVSRKVTVVVSKDRVRATESGVKKLKSTENVSMKAIGGVGWSKLVITRKPVPGDEHRVELTFSLLYSTHL
jgi:hypothetical protein